MRQWILIIGAGLLMASCSSRPLNEAECQLIIDKEIQFAVSKFPPEDAEGLREHLLKGTPDGVAKCKDGKTYNRRDYKCLLRADATEDMGKCIEAVSKRLGR